MTDHRRTSQTQMADLNQQLSAQNETVRNMLRVANQTDETTNNIGGELVRQGGVIQNNITKVHTRPTIEQVDQTRALEGRQEDQLDEEAQFVYQGHVVAGDHLAVRCQHRPDCVEGHCPSLILSLIICYPQS